MNVELVLEIGFQGPPFVDSSQRIIEPKWPESVNNPLFWPEQTVDVEGVIEPLTLCGIISINAGVEKEVEVPLCTTAL